MFGARPRTDLPGARPGRVPALFGSSERTGLSKGRIMKETKRGGRGLICFNDRAFFAGV